MTETLSAEAGQQAMIADLRQRLDDTTASITRFQEKIQELEQAHRSAAAAMQHFWAERSQSGARQTAFTNSTQTEVATLSQRVLIRVPLLKNCIRHLQAQADRQTAELAQLSPQ